MLYHSAFTRYFRDRLADRSYRMLLSPEFVNVGYVDDLVSKFLAGTELRGAGLGDLVAVTWLSACGWYGAAEGASHPHR